MKTSKKTIFLVLVVSMVFFSAAGFAANTKTVSEIKPKQYFSFMENVTKFNDTHPKVKQELWNSLNKMWDNTANKGLETREKITNFNSSHPRVAQELKVALNKMWNPNPPK